MTIRAPWHIVLAGLALIALTETYAFAHVTPNAPLPTPAGLDADVRFWEKIFSHYKPDQCVFHDKDDLSLVYVAKRLPGGTPLVQARNARRYLQAIRGAMQHLASGGSPRNLLEKHILSMTDPRLRTPAYYRYAMNNIRCQRGVDLTDSLTRSRRHLTMVQRVLKQKGLPTDLAYLPHLESGYNVRAHSRAGARGLWQLMPATARLAGMRVTRKADHRLDPAKSTEIASRLLIDLYAKTGSWPLAITGYNYGPNGIARAVRAYGNDYMVVREKHKTSLFGFAARNYYPSFLAVRNVARKMADDLAAESR